jgi:hypothetical protein
MRRLDRKKRIKKDGSDTVELNHFPTPLRYLTIKSLKHTFDTL